MTIILTEESVLSALDAIVEEFGEEHVYTPLVGGGATTADLNGPNCAYARMVDGEAVPDCIVGHVLVRHGLPADLLAWKGQSVNKYSTGTIWNNLPWMASEGLVTYGPRVRDILGNAQVAQDNGKTWGVAVASAREFVSLDV